ncbi:tetraspanin-5 isoform X1 [Atheta coriaria]|uniref:tetraspanin-5 isoform X1 n=1 Tax=Dalotia coriaria TaxID=877792 RepID=UPI0031F34FA8
MAAVNVPNVPVPIRKYRRDASEVSSCLKYMIFGFNVLFWWLGLGILTIGVWAWTEKDIFNNISKVANVALDPAFILMCIGTLTFVIGFTGCVGALRENTCLLGTYALFLAILLLFEMTAGIMGFIFKDWIKSQATIGFQTFIIHYREDPDQQNLIDWIQEDWLQCCGIEGPKDWDRNNYFNCSSHDVGSREACGVPFSCCKRKPHELIKNKQCGYDVRKPGFNDDVSKIVNEKGCLMAVEEWTERNMISLTTFAIIVLFFQILGICFAQNLRADIFAQKSKWH